MTRDQRTRVPKENKYSDKEIRLLSKRRNEGLSEGEGRKVKR